MKGLNFASVDEIKEMAKENVRLKQSNTRLRRIIKRLREYTKAMNREKPQALSNYGKDKTIQT